MAFKYLILCSVLVYVQAGYLAPALSYEAAPALAYSAPISYSAPAITSQSSNIYRSPGNLGQISTYSKSIDTPFSSVRKADVRISNPGLKISSAYGVPAVAYGAPAAAAYHGPLLGVAYSAAPAVAHVAFDSGVTHYAF
ncbi:unnamed protein product [Ceutorhynchus assimilis]|uniref:Uncharacterized protein n=1 Tax=Ceutorhynchus assimilis TaxID=467358 RepID=A0A9N9QM12_9CUCU|nr:unnamed protein product [Ceutorhynchus assimilis]